MMKITYTFIALAFLVLTGCQSDTSPSNAASDRDEQLAQLAEDYNQALLKFHPLYATGIGDHRYDDQLDNNISHEFEKEIIAFYEGKLEALAAIDRTSLSDEDQMTYDILEWECEINKMEYQLPMELLPLNQIFSRHLYIAQVASGSGVHQFKTVEDYDNWLSRLDVFVEWCNTALQNMKRGVELGYVLPKSLISKVIPQINDMATTPLEDHVFFMPAQNIPESISKDEQQRLKDAYAASVQDKIIPAFAAIHDYMAGDYMEAGIDMAGIQHVPHGTEIYNHYIKYYTTTDMTADEIFALGKSEVARLRDEMSKVMQEVGFTGTHEEFFDHVREKPELRPYTDPQQAVDRFNEIHETMKPHLEKLFDKTPSIPFEVRRTESFREASASAEYHPGSLEGDRPGIFYVPVPDVAAYNVFQDEDLFLHEAIPGHHYQISLQKENQNLPDFRKELWYSSYGEGWALYTESLGKELGLYTDPYQYFGMLSAEMHRAIRLVVDVGMHVKGWTREEAIQYSMENEAEPVYSIIAEIERYMAAPGQALSYKIGQLKIRELRERAEEELGDEFDIKQFHNEVLEPGCVPLAVLETSINRWIAEQKESE